MWGSPVTWSRVYQVTKVSAGLLVRRKKIHGILNHNGYWYVPIPLTADSKAASAQKAVLKGTHKKALRPFYTTTFTTPKTLKHPKNPQYARKVAPKPEKLDAHSVIVNPVASETAIKKVEDGNTLVFVVNMKANKNDIKDAVKQLYDVEVAKVNTLVSVKGTKKAFIKLTADHDALDVANRIGYV